MVSRPKLIVFAIVLSLCACKRSDRPKPQADEAAPDPAAVAEAPPVDDPAAARPGVELSQLPECPDDEALAAMLRAALSVAEDKTIEPDGCVAGRFPGPGFHIRAWIETMEDDQPIEAVHHQVILDAATRQRVAAAEPADIGPESRAMGEFGTAEGEAADVDGDGVDELFYIEEMDAKGTQQHDRVVLQVRGDKLVELARFVAHYQDSAAVGEDAASECSATFTLAAPGADRARSLTIEGRVTRAHEASPENTKDCIDGRRVYRLADGVLRPGPAK